MYSHILMALGFAAALLATFSIGRYGQATLFLLAIVEAFAGLRYPLHILVRNYLLEGRDSYTAKVPLQIGLLIGAGMAGLVVLLILLPVFARLSMGRRLMMAGNLIIVAMLGVELISLHQIDTAIYQPIGSFALCAIVYFCGGIMTAAGALLEGRRRRDVALSA